MKKHPILTGILLGVVAVAGVLMTRAVRTEASGRAGKKHRRGCERRSAKYQPENLMTEMNSRPTVEEITALARQYWEEEGQPDGKAAEHWHRAEAELHRRILEQSAANSATAAPPTVLGIS